ncbi:MAG: tetratricopeptide repeat protein [Planctomycetaceae bacterium]
MSDFTSKGDSAPKDFSAEVKEQFLKLYKDAYSEHRRAPNNATEDSPAHVAAVTHASQHGIPGAVELLKALILARQGNASDAWHLVDGIEAHVPVFLLGQAYHAQGFALYVLNEYDRAIECWQKAVETPGYDMPGLILNSIGIAFSKKEEYDRAIEYFQNALATPGYDTPGMTLNNLGAVYSDKQDYDLAIECYEKALQTDGYDTRGMTWSNIGLDYIHKKEYDRAIECLEEALDTPDYDTPGDAWHNLGLAYANKKEYKKAIECYENALSTPGYDTPQLTQVNLANTLRLNGQFEDALQLIDTALNAKVDADGQAPRVQAIRQLILEDMAGLEPDPEEEALATAPTNERESDSPESRMERKLQGLEDRYTEYKQREASKRNNTFSVLRGWSSAVTLLEGTKDGHWRGGGYFLKWQGHGIVIDPGFDFLDNFHDAGFHARDLDAVLVSHNHSDHNFDLRAVDDLRYEIFRRSIETTEEGVTKPMLREAVMVIDEDTATAFDDSQQKHRGSPFRLSRADYQHRRWLIQEHSGLPLTVEHFPVQHGADVPHAVGIRLRLHWDDAPDFVIGYTGDTKYFKGLADELQECDVLIAHISQPDAREFRNEEFLKPVHLGYNGVTKLIRETQPKLTLVGEFWAGLADLRVELIQGLRKRTGSNAILPAGLGMHVRLPSLEVECTECGKPVPHLDAKIVPPTFPFGPLGLLCRNCMV